MAMWEIKKARDIKLENESTTEAKLAVIEEARDVTGTGNTSGIPVDQPNEVVISFSDKLKQFCRDYFLQVLAGVTVVVVLALLGLKS